MTPRLFKKSDSALLRRIRSCDICKKHLPMGARPVVNFSPSARILIVGQAPGIRVHETGIPWNDPSGDRLREWLGVDKETFYDPKIFAIAPMGFCYPGTGKSGDLPPRPECAEKWMPLVLKSLKSIKVKVLAGRYAHEYFLGNPKVGENAKAWNGEETIPLPHPSPRNNLWLKKNPWFERDLVPELKRRVRKTVNS